MVPLLAIAGCHSSVLWLGGGEADKQVWWSGRGAIAGHCRVPF